VKGCYLNEPSPNAHAAEMKKARRTEPAGLQWVVTLPNEFFSVPSINSSHWLQFR
jgi:hypothetical protein